MLVSLAVAVVGSVVFPMLAMSAPITTIVNHSFEDHNAFSTNDPGGNVINTIVGWQHDDGVGTFEPSTSGNHFTTDVFNQDVPDGSNTAFSNEGNIWQVLTTTILAAGTTYNLSVEVGDRLDFALPLHFLELRAGGAILASAFASPANGEFAIASLTYSTILGRPHRKIP